MKPSSLETGGNKIDVTIRPASQTDTPQVLELTSLIWEGGDYVPYVWADWLADPDGQLIVAELDRRVVGLGKLTRLSSMDWWMEGLRVHPQYEGRGIGSRLHDYLHEYWLQNGAGTIRLATASFRFPVHHLCARSEFEKVGEFSSFRAPILEENQRAYLATNFQLITMEELPEAVDFALKSLALQIAYGLINYSWRWAPPALDYLARIAKEGRIWWWHDRRGLVALMEDEDEQKNRLPIIQFLACALDRIQECLLDIRRLAKAKGYTEIEWEAPLDSNLQPILQETGFERTWEHAMFIFAKKHPDRPGLPTAGGY